MDRRFVLKLIGGGAATAATSTAAPSLAGAVPRRLFTPSDATLVRTIELPSDVNGDDASWGRGLTVRRVGSEARLIAAALRGTVYEVRAADGMLTKVWGDVTGGLNQLDGGRGAGYLFGLHWDAPTRTLLWSFGDLYNTVAPNDPSIGASRLASGNVFRPIGAWRFNQRSCKMTMGGVLAVPTGFARTHLGGRRLAAGFGGYFSIATIGPISMGPALTAFDPRAMMAAPTGASIANVPMVGYPFTGAPGAGSERAVRDAEYVNDFDAWRPVGGVGRWNWTDYLGQAGVWIDTPGVHGVLFAPTIGNGRLWYETSTLHAERAKHTWHVYHPADLASVATGRAAQHAIQPKFWDVQYPTFNYPLPGWADGPTNEVVGVTFDRVDFRLYIAVRRPWSPGRPAGHLVAVYDIARR